MRRLNTSHAALAIAIAALFVALGGTALAVTQIGTNQIQNGAVTTSKLHAKAVTNGKLAANSVGTGKIKNSAVTTSKIANAAVTTSKIANAAVTTSNIANAAVTASQVAPNTFLPFDGTAADSSRLGGLLPADYIQGNGFTTDRRLVVPVNSTLDLFGAGFGQFTASCSATDQPSVTWTPTVADAEYSVQSLVYPSTVLLTQLNGIPAGGSDTEPSTATVLPIALQYSIGYTASGVDHVATAYITGRFESGTGCVFVGQGTSTG